MRHFIVCAGILLLTARVFGQSAPATTEPTASSTTPALTKTVAANPNDSPMVRAAKRAVAARVHPSQRRVISLTTSNTRGRLAFATGPTEGPKVPPPAPTGPTPAAVYQAAMAKQEAAKRAVAVQEKLEQLQIEASRLNEEIDEPYGNDVDEDLAEKRLAEIEAERKKLQQANPPPPPPRQ